MCVVHRALGMPIVTPMGGFAGEAFPVAHGQIS